MSNIRCEGCAKVVEGWVMVDNKSYCHDCLVPVETVDYEARRN